MKTWEITRALYKVSDFVTWQKTDALVLSPSFQRRPVWKAEAKSFLIDTVIRGLPMPIIFLREMSDIKTLRAQREVIDGQQRIRTLLTYIHAGLLKDYDAARDNFTIKRTHNAEFAGKTFNELPNDVKLRILDYQFSVHILPPNLGDREVLQLFARLNATGVRLNDQELRNAEYYGELKSSVYELAAEQLDRWRAWGIFSEYNIARMDEVGLVSEFALLATSSRIQSGTAKALNALYEEHDEAFTGRQEFERRFRWVMDLIDSRFGSSIRVSSFSKKTLFYVLFACIYDLAFGIESPLHHRKAKSITADQVAWIRAAEEKIANRTAPKSVIEATERRTTHPSSRSALLKYLVGRSTK